MTLLPANRKILVFESAIIMIAGTLVSAFCIKASLMEAKWLIFVAASIISASLIIITSNRETYLLYFTAFILPLLIDWNMFFEEAHFQRPINGFVISISDLPIGVLMCIWMFRIVVHKTSKIILEPFFVIPFLLMWGLSIPGLYSALNASLQLKAAVLWTMLKNLLIVVYVSNNIKEKQMMYRLIAFIILSGIMQALIGMGQHLNNGPLGLKMLGEQEVMHVIQDETSRIGGTIGHPNKFALFLGIIIQITLACCFAVFPDTYKYYNYFFFLSLFPLIGTLIITYSRSGWLSFIISGMISSYWCIVRKSKRKVFSAFIVIGGFAFFCLLALVGSESIQNRLFKDDKGSYEIRKPLKQTALNIIYHHPFWGVGLNNYTAVIHKYDISSMWGSYHFPQAVHNEFLLIAAEAGIPVLCLFIYILIYVFHTLLSIIRQSSDSVMIHLSIGFFCSLIGWIIHNQNEFQYVFFTIYFWFYIGIIIGMKNILKSGSDHKYGIA